MDDSSKTPEGQAAEGAPAPVRVDARPPRADLGRRLEPRGLISEAGGMGIITEILDRNLLRVSACKTVRDELADDPDTIRRMTEEAQITAQLDHPGVVPVHELGIDASGRLFFTMLRVRGRTLAEVLAEKPARERTDKDLYALLQIVLKVCDAVAFAHSRGVVHRDLKPDNVMVGEYGEVFVMDWGVAHLVGPKPQPAPVAAPDAEPDPWDLPRTERNIVGTPSYMAPEQAMGEEDRIDARTDVFTLGGILYEILTGRPPYVGPNAQACFALALQGEVEPPETCTDVPLPPRLCRIAMQALSWDPAHRHPSVAVLREEIEGFLRSAWQFPTRTFPAGSLILREGDEGDEAYVVRQGRCRAFRTVDGKKQILEEMGPGDVFGEIAILTRQPRTASVEAIEPVTALEITGSYLDEEMGSSYWLTLFVRALAERFRHVSAQLAEAQRRT